MSQGAGGYKGGSSKAAIAGGYAGRRMPTIANAGGYKSGLGGITTPTGRRMPQGNPTQTSSDAMTISYTITRHPDGTVSETYSMTMPNAGNYSPNDGFNGMPYTGLFEDGPYTKLMKQGDEEERKRRERALEAQKGSQHKCEVFDPTELVSKPTRFIEEAKEIQPHVEEAYFKIMGKKLPNNFSLKLCDKDELKVAYEFFKGTWQNGIQGFCINRTKGTSRVFVLKDELAKVMLTIGHEIGHLQTASLSATEEEAKAYAFSLEWMKVIRKNNIANLGSVMITERPAENGLHNVAFEYVLTQMKNGTNAMHIFEKLVNGQKIAI